MTKIRAKRVMSVKKESAENRMDTMAYKISDDCIACGTCAGVCPVSAISEGDGKYVIDPDVCLDCGTCEGECPVSAISAG